MRGSIRICPGRHFQMRHGLRLISVLLIGLFAMLDLPALAASIGTITLSPTPEAATVGRLVRLDVAVKNQEGIPMPGTTVRFSVTGANAASGSTTTDNHGQTRFNYSGSHAGTDTAVAYADINENGIQDSEEPSATTTVTWSASPSAPAAAFPTASKPGCDFYAETQHNLCGGFREYWNQFGGVENFGYPLTEEFQEDGFTVQYFERAEFEWHPGAWPQRYDVLLTRLGSQVMGSVPVEAVTERTSAGSGCRLFAETGHDLCGGFQGFWNAFGGLPVFGLPISQEFQEQNPDNGQTYTVQYFERARFEWHPGFLPSRYDVELGRIGAHVLTQRYGVPS
jgi:hypothetical protein